MSSVGADLHLLMVKRYIFQGGETKKKGEKEIVENKEDVQMIDISDISLVYIYISQTNPEL